MFNSKTKLSDTGASALDTTIIGAGTIIEGNVESQGDIRIDGTLMGNLTVLAKIIICAYGNVSGIVKGKHADILGKVTGQLEVAELLQLRGNCVIEGDIVAGKLEVAPTATFNGRCQMSTAVETKETPITLLEQ